MVSTGPMTSKTSLLSRGASTLVAIVVTLAIVALAVVTDAEEAATFQQVPAGSIDAAQPVCEACKASGIFRPDED